jgi:putative spermidine/putrescine transport system substrate-binding protein
MLRQPSSHQSPTSLTNLQKMTADKDAPKMSVVIMDDPVMLVAAREGLITPITVAGSPNLGKPAAANVHQDGMWANCQMPWAGIAYNTNGGKAPTSWSDLYAPEAAGKVIIPSLKNTEGYWALLSAAPLETGKPYKEAQYDVDAGFKKLATLKPNLLNVYTDAPQAINLLEQGEAQMIGGQFSAYTLTRKAAGSPVDLAIPSDGSFAMPSGITKVKNGPAGDIADAIVNMFLGPDVQSVLATKAFVAPTNPETAEASGISGPQPIVRAGLGLLRQGARRLGGPLEPTLSAHVAVAGLSKRYGAANVLDRVDFSVDMGALVTLLGPSGCGKTTLLRLIAGLVTPDEGSVSIAGVDVTRTRPHKRNVGVVFQNYALFPHLTVGGNVGFGLQRRGLPRDAVAAKVERALELVQMGAYADRPVRALSGGQQQRVALARALCSRTERAPVRRGFERARPEPARDDAGRAAPSSETNWRDGDLCHA